ncbi:MAG: aminotransferase class I/II-fold pyridoxal phosphate-dependent enzyme [Acidimicrobiales bacterium]
MPVRYHLEGGSAHEIVAGVEDALRRGALGPGAALPPVRRLAQELHLSPTTVAAAYRELRRRGVATGAGRAGTRIRPRPPSPTPLMAAVPKGVRDLRVGWPDPHLLPALPRACPSGRLYGEAAVAANLRLVAQEHLGAEGIPTEHLAVVGGALDGVERALGASLRPGDRVVVEDPCYPAVLDLLAAMSLEVLPAGMDDLGALPAALGSALARGAAAAVLSPRAQNPLGAAWDEGRAGELRAVLRRYPEVLLIEDDHAGPVAGVPLHTLAGATERWATVRSVSKWLSPDLRLAVLCGDGATVHKVEGRQALGTGWVSYLLQDMVSELWRDPATTRLLERAASTYAARRQALLGHLAAHGALASSRSGLTTWVHVGDEVGVATGLLQAGWAVTPGARFRIAAPPGIRVAHSTLEPKESARFAADLARLLSGGPAVRAD